MLFILNFTIKIVIKSLIELINPFKMLFRISFPSRNIKTFPDTFFFLLAQDERDAFFQLEKMMIVSSRENEKILLFFPPHPISLLSPIPTILHYRSSSRNICLFIPELHFFRLFERKKSKATCKNH